LTWWIYSPRSFSTHTGIYFLGRVQAGLGGVAISGAGARVIQILTPANTQGLSQHSFAMLFKSNFGQTAHFETRLLAIDPQ
jgi:hypothetical protein